MKARRNMLPADVRARLAPLLTSAVGDARTFSQRFGFRRATARDLLNGTAPIVLDSRRARKLAGLLVRASHDAREASSCHDHANRLLAMARHLGERAYEEAMDQMRCESEESRYYADRRSLAFKPGVQVAPCLSSNGLPMIVAIGEKRELISMAEVTIKDEMAMKRVMSELLVFVEGVHYAPWIPASGVGCTLLAVGANGELVAWTDIEQPKWAEMLRAAIGARHDLEALLPSQGTTAASWHDSSEGDDDDDDEDDDAAGEEWKGDAR